jgi:hypothetical protein
MTWLNKNMIIPRKKRLVLAEISKMVRVLNDQDKKMRLGQFIRDDYY